LLQENLEKDEKIKGLKLQLNRQINTIQGIYSDNDRTINEYNLKIVQIIEEGGVQKQTEAA
jgi:hypothetical protein